MSETPKPRLSTRQLREAAVLTVAGIKMQSHLKDYVPVAKEVGAGVLVRARWDTVSFVFKDEETSKLAYQEFEHGRARSMLLPFAQWDLYIAVRPVARVAFSTCEPMEELVEDETRRIYVEDEFKPEHVHCASPTSPEFLPQSPPSGRASRRPRHDRSTSNTSLTGSAGDYNKSKSSGSYFDSSVGSIESRSSSSRPPVVCHTCRRLFFPIPG